MPPDDLIRIPEIEILPPLDRPLWKVVITACKRAGWESLPIDEQERGRLAQIEARTNATARKLAKKALARSIYTRLFDGEKLEDIARAVGRTVHGVRAICASWGFPAHQRSRARRAPLFWITDESYAALVRAAADRRSTVAEMLEDLIQFVAEDDALILRRTLHVRRANI